MNATLFKTLENEIDASLAVEGAIPHWLNGVLMRNGPAKFEQGGHNLNHWFDGYAMLHKFVIMNGKAWYKNRFLHSSNYLADHQNKYITKPVMGVLPTNEPSFFQKIINLFLPILYDNNNVGFTEFAGKYFTTSDYSTLMEFNIHSLETIGQHKFNDEIGDKFMISAAHPCLDPETQDLYNFVCEVAPIVTYHLFKIDGKTGKRTRLYKFHRSKPTVIHSTSLTPNYYILIETPLKVDFWDLWFQQFKSLPYCETIYWDEKAHTNFYMLNRHTGEMTKIQYDGFFFFHVINAYEREGKVYIDISQNPKGEFARDYYLDKFVQHGISEYHKMRPVGFEIDLQKKSVRRQAYTESCLEMPVIHPDKLLKPYRYTYGINLKDTTHNGMYDRLIKLDVQTGEVVTWEDPGSFPGEPVFVPKPGATKEDEGVLMSVMIDVEGEKSFLVMLDAESMQEIARVVVPHLIPLGFHGKFYESQELISEFEREQLQKFKAAGYEVLEV